MNRLSIATVALLLACVGAKTEFLTPERYAPIASEEVAVFASIAELQVDSITYIRIAVIYTEGTKAVSDQLSLLRKAKEEAAKIGANGIVMTSADAGGTDLWRGKVNESQWMAVRWRMKER